MTPLRSFSVVRRCLAVGALVIPGIASIACSGSPESVASGSSSVVASTATVSKSTFTPTPDGTVSGTYPGYGVPGYEGGPILSGGPTYVTPIFYGTAWQPGYQQTMMTFLKALSGTSYWQVVNEYSDGSGNHPGPIVVQSEVDMNNYTYGYNIAPPELQAIVQTEINAIGSAGTLYLIFTADDVNVLDGPYSLCNNFLGYHGEESFTWVNRNFMNETGELPYAVIGSPEFCVQHPSTLPPVDAGAGALEWNQSINTAVYDQAVTIVEHEMAESVTDPFPDTSPAWSPEIGDICAWQPGPSTFDGLGYYDLGEGKPYASNQVGYASNFTAAYLVQTIWDKTQGACAYGPAALDLLTESAACGAAVCGTAPNGGGGYYTCGTCLDGLECRIGRCVRR